MRFIHTQSRLLSDSWNRLCVILCLEIYFYGITSGIFFKSDISLSCLDIFMKAEGEIIIS